MAREMDFSRAREPGSTVHDRCTLSPPDPHALREARMIPLRDTIRPRRFPLVNYAIIALNVVVFMYELSLGRRGDAFLVTYGLVPRHFTLSALFTSMFLHGGWLHLFGNMLY